MIDVALTFLLISERTSPVNKPRGQTMTIRLRSECPPMVAAEAKGRKTIPGMNIPAYEYEILRFTTWASQCS